jgi:hypothetical protein
MNVTLSVHPTASDQARRDTSVAMVFGGSIINPIKGDEKVSLPSPLIWSTLSSSCMNVTKHIQPTAFDQVRRDTFVAVTLVC